MAGRPNKLSRFWQEVKRRKTDRVIVLYAAAAFTILELIEMLGPALSLPDGTMIFMIVILSIGFPVTVIFSWIFNITPGGIEKTRPLSEKKRHSKQMELRTWKSTTLISIIVIIALIFYNIVKGSIGINEIRRIEKTIAVLPFKNTSDNDKHAYFGDAITDEIIMQLQKIRKFTVRSMTSVMQYKDTEKSISVIGKELNANFIVEGSIQLFDDQFRIRVQLINANKDYHLWGDIYEENWKDIFTVQPEIAKQIADNLKTVLTPEEIKKIEKNPTNNINAYSEYLSGNKIGDEARYFFLRGNMYIDSTIVESAIESYNKAIEYDPSFALAYAKRAITYSTSYYLGSRDPVIETKCKEDIEKALEIDPELTEAQIAYGFYYYYCKQDYPEALKHFKNASDKNPDNWEPIFYMASVHRRYGNWPTSQSLMTRVLKYNPQDALVLTNIGISYDYLRKYDSAQIYHEKAINVMPKWESPYINGIESLILENGTTEKARNLLDSAINKTGKSFLSLKILLDIYDGKFDEALIETKKILNKEDLSDRTFPNDYSDKLLLCGMVNRYLNNSDASKAYFDSALVVLNKDLDKDPENAELYSKIGIAYAGLKNKMKAVEAGEKAVKLTEDNVLKEMDRKEDLARIFVMLEDFESCLKQIDYLLKNPSCFSLKLLQVDPVWKPLIFHPEFQGLLIKYSKI
jgi:TolB-like protein/Tfp pilus assembly protein PilF